MKYIYTLLLSLFIFNHTLAENWVKYELPENSVIEALQFPGNCIKYADNKIDSVDLDCIETMLSLSITLKSIHERPATDTLKFEDIQLWLDNMPLLNAIGVGTIFTSNYNNTSILIDYGQVKNRITSGISLYIPYDSVFLKNVPTDINSAFLSLTGRYLEIDTLKNIPVVSIFVDYPWEDDIIRNTLSVNIRHIEKIQSFDCRRVLANALIDLPNDVQNLVVAINNENVLQVVQKISEYKNSPNQLNGIAFFYQEDIDSLDISGIQNVESFLFYSDGRNMPVLKKLASNNFKYLSLHSTMIEDFDLPESLEYFSANNYYGNNSFSIPVLNHQLKELHLSSLSGLTALPPLPDSLEKLNLSDLDLNCLPSFPPSLKNFSAYGLRNVKCIPNETPWVRATVQWPLCTDAQFVCDQDFQFVNGKIFLDLNNNGIIDETDTPLPEAVISTDKNQFAKSKEDGSFGIILREEGNYVLSAKLNNPYSKQSVPANVTINYQEGQSIDSVHFLIQLDNKNDIQINGTNLVARPGMSTTVHSFIENLSLENKEELTVKILQPGDWSLKKAAPENYIVSNDTIIWNNVSISALASKTFSISTILPPTATILGDAYQYEMWVENDGDITPENNYYSIIDTIIGSYDPNDKIVNHSSLTPELSNTKELIYTIRFQNTGTDTAFKVVIIDTIIGNLEPASIRVIGASHNYTWDFTGQGIATFVFDNILLPDSNINEPGSHGFVTLALRPDKNLVEGDSIYNRAGIYFDFNEPVITNHANTKIATVSPVYNHSNIPLSIYPNPAKNQVRVEWNVTEPAILRLTDISGKVIRTERLNNGFTDINVSQLPKGLYIIQLQAGQDMAVSKLIVQ